jgi:hypothetical protein
LEIGGDASHQVQTAVAHRTLRIILTNSRLVIAQPEVRLSGKNNVPSFLNIYTNSILAITVVVSDHVYKSCEAETD